MKLSFSVVILLLFHLTVSGQKVDEYEMHQLRALENLNKFGVYIWEIEGYHADSTLTASDIESYVHKKLNNAGINPVSFSDAR